MIASLVLKLIGLGVPAKLAKPLIYFIGALLIVGAFLGLKACYDSSIINTHDAKVEASAAKADRAADQKAADQAAKDLARRQYETDQLTEAMRNAAKDPAIPDDRERALAFHRCLSLQQRARANGIQPPRCV